MTTLLTRTFRDRCTLCQVGQGRNYACREAMRIIKPRKWRISPTEWLWLLIAADVAVLWLAVKLADMAWRAWA